MDDFSVINASEYKFNQSDVADGLEHASFIVRVVSWITVGVGLPLNVAAIYKTSSLVRTGHAASIYFTNLLVSNLIQLVSLTVLLTAQLAVALHFFFLYLFGLMASVAFMACIALERYSLVISTRCSCFRRVMEITVVVCFLFWAPPLLWLFRVVDSDLMRAEIKTAVIAVLVFFPFPLLIFSLGGTIKALPAASSVPPGEKRRTVAVQVLVLLICTLLFLPCVIVSMATSSTTVTYVAIAASRLLPLADVGVYVSLRGGPAADRLLASGGCCRTDKSGSRVSDDAVTTASSV